MVLLALSACAYGTGATGIDTNCNTAEKHMGFSNADSQSNMQNVLKTDRLHEATLSDKGHSCNACLEGHNSTTQMVIDLLMRCAGDNTPSP